jgi:tetratricopeptide (TPR) repeat protein
MRHSSTRFLALAFVLVLGGRPVPVANLYAITASDSLWQKRFSEGRQLRKVGRYAEAEKAQSLALAEAEKFGPEDRRLALSLNELAILHHSRGQLNEAELLYRRALAIGEKVSERLEVATLLSNLARLYFDLQKHDEVERLSKRALEISQPFAPKHPEVANSLANLADVQVIQGRYARAEPLYRQALTILEEAFGTEHIEVAYNLGHLARLLSGQARYAEAEAKHRRAITILQKNPGEQDSTLANSLNNLADQVVEQGRNTEAEPLVRRQNSIRAGIRIFSVVEEV